MTDSALQNICLALAAISAQVGSVVAVFIAFASQELRRAPLSAAERVGPKFFQDEWNRSRMWMLGISSVCSISDLMLTSLFAVVGVYQGFIDLRRLTAICIATFCYGIDSILFVVLLYLYQERRYMRAYTRSLSSY